MRLSARQRGYDTRWERARADFLVDHPLCAMCLSVGVVTIAKAVDHKIPHRGDRKLFWDRKNWQSLCASHHAASKQRAEARGVADIGCGADGVPNDAGHHWRA